MRDSEQPGETDGGSGERERTIDERESHADAWDAAQAERDRRAKSILAIANARDEQADVRDSAADSRDRVASLDSFLRDDDADHDAALKARRAGALDRKDSKDDRSAAAEDRSHLAEGVTPPAEGD